MDYLEIIRQAEEAHQPIGLTNKAGGKPTRPLQLPSVKPGDQITWQGAEGKIFKGVIDFLHPSTDEVWAFCTLIDGGWTAVNVKYIDGDGHSKTDAQGTTR